MTDQSELAALRERAKKAEEERDELQCTLDLQIKSNRRGIEQWQKATGKDLVWPDHARLVEWALSERDAATARAERAEEALRQCRTELADFQRLAHGKTEFPPTKGMELADAVLSGDHSEDNLKMVGRRQKGEHCNG